MKRTVSLEASIRAFKRLLFLFDGTVGALSGLLAAWLAGGGLSRALGLDPAGAAGGFPGPWETISGGHSLSALAGYAAAWPLLLAATGTYRRHRFLGLADEARHTGLAALLLTLGFLSLLYFLPQYRRPDHAFLAVLFPLQFALAIGGRTVLRQAVGALRRRGLNRCRVLVVGSGEAAERFAADVLSHPEWGIDLVGFLNGQDKREVLGYSVLGPVHWLPGILAEEVVDEVVIAQPGASLAEIGSLVAVCEEQGKAVHVAAGAVIPTRYSTRRAAEIAGTPVVSFLPGPTESLQLAVKRAIDILGAVVALVLAAPFLPAIALAIKLDSPGPVFFVQERVGLHGRRFRMVKFRTMVADAEERLREVAALNEMSGPVFKVRDDPRVTRVGRFLRRMSLDELPQLWNVLKGEMSLVGPRPPLPREVARYDVRQRRRLSVKPGLTCLWQVSGRNNVPFERWVELDLEYIDSWNLWLDIKILARTLPAVLGMTGM